MSWALILCRKTASWELQFARNYITALTLHGCHNHCLLGRESRGMQIEWPGSSSASFQCLNTLLSGRILATIRASGATLRAAALGGSPSSLIVVAVLLARLAI